ncbi:GRAM domain-containing protein YSP2 AltName: Full=Yeast suicide protein 2 [Rhizoctonia solani AG-1 IB]|uniref:Rhizoctonia solani AG1-IB WGS project CAOJ00000000 data, isolate 7/3/14, contig 08780 n=1 Tax=Thanatephorus cucumeris (strain AG1-IB / isolate 7/3/14) TaxID=1108050 RepID=M5BQU9_THACB|nr:GRAM domain-containing protein YSP2 AltName: Full=Yeast suicide protein 2 [Rhizoctonia solani AG-1 IB]
MDIVLPGTPEKIYNLMFASGFLKDFMAGEQKLMEIQISDWHPEQSGSQLLTRNMTYIKPLNGSIGPKQTKCELKDETLHVDFDDYVSTLTTTRTPDVPSGSVFSVKTRTCIMWAGAAASRLLVTTTVEWTGRSFIRSIIDKSATDGQKQYHVDLEKAMRSYIAAHRTEFVPDDVAEDPEALAAADTTISAENAQATQTKADRARETELRGLQWTRSGVAWI